MQVYSRIEGRWDGFLPLITHTESADYSGSVAEAKKGRESQAKVTEDALARTKANTALQNQLQAETDPFRKSLIATQPGEMSPYARAAYDSKIRNIADTYEKVRQVGLRGLSYQGGAKPVGMRGSMINTANENQGRAETDAYSQGLQDTLNQGLEGVNIANQQQQIRNPEQAAGTASNSAYYQSKMGSTLGDIGAGIKGIADAASSFTNAGGIKNIFKSAWGGKQG